ncbi:MAG: hypothetical protein JRH18_12720 [Deltaproteobacteria bacterium]|nr:hypothetical protein [Deltaproteobacteria bacterium]MBW1961360.1 hypothetical protein [Deltaproteobacteria bacterium]MBW2152520.1 hypothetical protein [Deltaproteobacteria bacterium]
MNKRCNSCKGSGEEICDKCAGRGYTYKAGGETEDCDACGGLGVTDCPMCNGIGNAQFHYTPISN